MIAKETAFDIIVPMGIGSTIGAFIGSYLMTFVSSGLVKLILGFILKTIFCFRAWGLCFCSSDWYFCLKITGDLKE